MEITHDARSSFFTAILRRISSSKSKAIQPFPNEALMSATLTLLAGIALIAVGVTMVIRRRRSK